MFKKRINAILWRSYLSATSSALWGLSSSQYYFELPQAEPDFDKLFGDQAVRSRDERGNLVLKVRLEPFEGTPPVDEYELRLTKLRDDVERAGNWQVYLPGESAYPLWQKVRGPLKSYQEMDSNEKIRNFIVIARDVDGRFHGRWIRGDDFHSLPVAIQTLLTTKAVGWSKL